jgi:hypothetical protein
LPDFDVASTVDGEEDKDIVVLEGDETEGRTAWGACYEVMSADLPMGVKIPVDCHSVPAIPISEETASKGKAHVSKRLCGGRMLHYDSDYDNTDLDAEEEKAFRTESASKFNYYDLS